MTFFLLNHREIKLCGHVATSYYINNSMQNRAQIASGGDIPKLIGARQQSRLHTSSPL